jgi:hypothetical protein
MSLKELSNELDTELERSLLSMPPGVIWATVVSAQWFCDCLPSLFSICLVRFAFSAVDGVLGPSVSFSPLQFPWFSVTQGPFTVPVLTLNAQAVQMLCKLRLRQSMVESRRVTNLIANPFHC